MIVKGFSGGLISGSRKKINEKGVDRCILCALNTRVMRTKKKSRSAESRRNLYFPREVWLLAEEQAKRAHRSVSNYLQTLVLKNAESGQE